MARPEQLAPYGAINPTSKPVSAFVEPNSQIVLGQPQQPAQFNAPKGIKTVGTAGSPQVQGYNSFETLAQDLAPFSEQLMKAAQKGGLAFASWQMDLGEQAALEQTAEAALRLDEEVETSELNRAAENRALAVRDPYAGGIMNMLNPYRSIGYRRGLSKRAGQEIENGLANYVSQNSDRIDYLAPDQGFAALQAIRAEYTNGVLDKYGIDSGSPGFSKYTAPRIERASDAVAQTLQKDRTEWIDSQKPRQVAALLQAEWRSITANRAVTYNGTVYRAADPGYEGAVRARLNQISTAELMTGGLPGQQSKWEKEVFQILAATGDFRGDGTSPTDYLATRTPMIGVDGKQKVSGIGEPLFYSWKELYSQEDIDSEIKYGQARWTQTSRTRKEYASQLSAQVTEATMGMRPGPEREAVITQTINNFMDTLTQLNGQPVDAATRDYLYEAARKGSKQSYEGVVMADDPRVVTDFVQGISAGTGPFNGASARAQLQGLVNSVNDPELAARLASQGMTAIDEREKQEDVVTRFSSTFNPIIDRKIEGLLSNEYTYDTPRDKRNRPIAEENVRAIYEPAVQDAIRAKEQELQRRMTQTEAAQVTRDVIKAIKPEDLEGAFPNGRTQREQQKNQSTSNTSSPAAATGSQPTPIAATYSNEGLASIPNRRVVLRQYQSVRFMDSIAIDEAVSNSWKSYDQPRPLLRAYRDSGAKSLYDFVNAQYELLKQQFPDYEPTWTDQQWLRFKTRSQRTSGLERGAYSTANLVQSRPMLASIQGSMVSIPFGV